MEPLIGVTPDIVQPSTGRPRVQVAQGYLECIAAAGGVPITLSPDPSLVPHYLDACHGFVSTGGDDPLMEHFGVETHPAATPVHPARQKFELALLDALDRSPQTPLLAICLGMQYMSLHAGGKLCQHLPEHYATASDHAEDRAHAINSRDPSALASGAVASSHHQSVSDPGRLDVIATAHDGVIEAIRDPRSPFRLGVQWHPERTSDHRLGQELFDRLVTAAKRAQLNAPAP